MQKRCYRIWIWEYSNERKNSTFLTFKDYSLWTQRLSNRSSLLWGHMDYCLCSPYRKPPLNISGKCLLTEEKWKTEINFSSNFSANMDLAFPYTQIPFWILLHDLHLVYPAYFSLTPHTWAVKCSWLLLFSLPAWLQPSSASSSLPLCSSQGTAQSTVRGSGQNLTRSTHASSRVLLKHPVNNSLGYRNSS